MKAYVTEICINCRNFLYLRQLRGLEQVELVDITASTANLKEFLHLRDNRQEFAPRKAAGMIGIPCFVDGERLTLDVNEALSWLGEGPVQPEEIREPV